jgi:ABC-type spermidine/putrescine transport system permease subunit II
MRSRPNAGRRGAPWSLRLLAWGGLVFLYLPIVLVAVYAFTTEESAFRFPPQGFTLRWFQATFARRDVLDAAILSVQVARCCWARSRPSPSPADSFAART